MNISSVRVPAIVSDIDGVLVHGRVPIPRSADGIRFLKASLKDIDRERFSDIEERIPFVCLTNAGGFTERTRAETLSSALQLKDDSERLHENEVIMNYTPLRPIMQEYRDRMVLLGGLGDLESLAKDIGLQKFITDEEFCALFPFLLPNSGRPHEGESVDALRKKIAARLNIVDEAELDEPFQIHAVFMLHDPIIWDERIQIICDLLSTSNGTIAQTIPHVGPEDHIPVYCANNDLTYKDHFRIARNGFGCFNESLKQVYKMLYKRDLGLKMYGKPSKTTYDFTEKYVKGLTGMEISNIYMIGDNPKSDIRGGNNAGWKTILVKTGVFQQAEGVMNDPEDPANYVVENFAEAIKLICELEGIKCDL